MDECNCAPKRYVEKLYVLFCLKKFRKKRFRSGAATKLHFKHAKASQLIAVLWCSIFFFSTMTTKQATRDATISKTEALVLMKNMVKFLHQFLNWLKANWSIWLSLHSLSGSNLDFVHLLYSWSVSEGLLQEQAVWKCQHPPTSGCEEGGWRWNIHHASRCIPFDAVAWARSISRPWARVSERAGLCHLRKAASDKRRHSSRDIRVSSYIPGRWKDPKDQRCLIAVKGVRQEPSCQVHSLTHRVLGNSGFVARLVLDHASAEGINNTIAICAVVV